MTIILALMFAVQTSAADRIEQAVREGIDAGAFPGAVVVVGTRGGILHARGYGHFTWSDQSPVPDPETTLYDLASLTKVVATTPVLMHLVDQGLVDLDHPVERYLPEFVGSGKAEVTVRHLLEHRSGLRAFLPLNKETGSAAEARQRVFAEPLRWPPGSRVVYSDLNALLLGWLVERLRGESLAVASKGLVFDRLGMERTGYLPDRKYRSQMVPVGLWRGHVIAGEVHDQNAARLDGVAGHAGAYSTGLDLARYAQMYLRGGRDENDRVVFGEATIREFTARGAGNRARGWEMRDTTSADNTGRLLSDRAFGHGGYTGTSLWIDPGRDLFVIVLTNRVFAPKTRRSITTLKAVRGKVADAAVALRQEACASAVVAAGTRGAC